MCVCGYIKNLLAQWEKKVNILEWIGPQGDFFLVIYFSSTRVSSLLHCLQEIIIIGNGVPFDLYSDDCFDKFVFFKIQDLRLKIFSSFKLSETNFRLCWCCFSVSLFFFFLQDCILCICVSVRTLVSMYVYILSGVLFFFYYSSSPLIIYDSWYAIKFTHLLPWVIGYVCERVKVFPLSLFSPKWSVIVDVS